VKLNRLAAVFVGCTAIVAVSLAAAAVHMDVQWRTKGGEPDAVATAAGHHVYVAVHPSASVPDEIGEYTASGKLLRTFGELEYATRLAIDPAGHVFVTDAEANRHVVEYTGSGKLLRKWGRGGSGPGQLHDPDGIAVDREGDVFVADTGNDRIQEFTASGHPIRAWGTKGKDPGQFFAPSDVAIAPSGDVVVADFRNQRIQEFSPKGVFIRQFGNGLGAPWGVATDTSGRVFAIYMDQMKVRVFSPKGDKLGQWGGFGHRPGQFSEPSDIAVGREGRAFVADTNNRRIQGFSRIKFGAR
jgi:tripartite motif-containing protein 71